MTTLELRGERLRLALRPDLGGAVAGLWFDGLPVLRSTEGAALASARDGGCYPLVPYSNRLGYRRFRWLGQEHRTAPNFDASPHSLHGVGWLRAWEVASHDAHGAELRYRHAPDDHWPFAFEAVQRVRIDGDAVRFDLACTNTHGQPQPLGLGWHPYFPKRTRSRVHAEVAERWDSDASGLPTRRVAQPGGIDGDVAHLGFDHCFAGWRGAARLRDERLSLRLTASLPYLVVYTPADKAYYCVEPVSHVSNAVHMADPAAHGLPAVASGSALEAWMRLEVAAA